LNGNLNPIDPELTSAVVICGDGGGIDSDADGCTDAMELSATALLGGQRDPFDYWDFYDTPDAAKARDKVVSAADVARIVQRFGAAGDASADPLSIPPDEGYHTAYDRGGQAGNRPWKQAPANGSITAGDIAAAVGQFGHSCA
jgi:hypothetical protein